MFFPGWIDLVAELRASAEARRGAFDLELPGGRRMRWPHTTGGDALAIAAVVDPHVSELAARADDPRLVDRWRGVVTRMEHLALARTSQTYSDNRELWSCLDDVATSLELADAALPDDGEWSALVQRLGDLLGLRNRGPMQPWPFREQSTWPFKEHTGVVETFHDLYLAQHKYLKGARGSDRREPAAGMTGSAMDVPRTTNADALSLYLYWKRQLDVVPKRSGHATSVALVQKLDPDMQRIAKGAVPTATFSDNHALWRTLANVARQVSAADEGPRDTTTWDAFTDVLALPWRAGEALVKGAAGASKSLIQTVTEWGRSLYRHMGLVVGTGIFGLIGLLLLLRRRDG